MIKAESDKDRGDTMFRFFRLFGSQYLGFWILGLLLFAVQEIPYMVMPLIKPQSNPIMNMKESSAFLDISEKILGSSCIALMTFIVHKDSALFDISEGRGRIFFGLAVLVLLLNFFGWGLYYTGHQSVLVMLLFIVVMPPLFYVFIGLWRKNILLTVTGAVFLAVHFSHVLCNFKAGGNI